MGEFQYIGFLYRFQYGEGTRRRELRNSGMLDRREEGAPFSSRICRAHFQRRASCPSKEGRPYDGGGQGVVFVGVCRCFVVLPEEGLLSMTGEARSAAVLSPLRQMTKTRYGRSREPLRRRHAVGVAQGALPPTSRPSRRRT